MDKYRLFRAFLADPGGNFEDKEIYVEAKNLTGAALRISEMFVAEIVSIELVDSIIISERDSDR